MALGWIAGGAAVIGGIFGSNRAHSNQKAQARRQYEAEQAQFRNQVAANAYKTTFQKLMIEQHNKRTTEIYDKQLEQYREQVGLNSEAALGAYAQEQRVLNEQFAHHMFRKQTMLRELFKIQGNQRAAGQGNTNKSLERANLINALGEFGMEQHMLDQNLQGVKRAYRERLGGIGSEWEHADRDAFAKIAIAPRLMLPETGAGPQLTGPVAPARIKGPGFGSFLSNVSQGIMVGSAVHSLVTPGTSDIELKENIVHVGKSPSGINIFEYNYLGETIRHRGAMAQEVLVKKPEAVVEMDNGYLGINYDMIDVNPKQLTLVK